MTTADVVTVPSKGIDMRRVARPDLPGPDHFDFYRCVRCGRLITLLEEIAAHAGARQGAICPCGSRKYSPANLRWWQWGLPRAWRMAVARLRGVV